jgi:hypothetical protein
VPVDYTKQVGDKANGEQIISISEKPNTSNDDGTNVIPAEWGLVDFRKSKTTTLIWVSNVSLNKLH